MFFYKKEPLLHEFLHSFKESFEHFKIFIKELFEFIEVIISESQRDFAFYFNFNFFIFN